MSFFLKNKSFPPAKRIIGFTLVEVVVAVAVFLTVALAIYDGYVSLLKMVANTRLKTAAVALANENLEIIRNLPYEAVGLTDQEPVGRLSGSTAVTRSGANFLVNLAVKNIDDPFDGLAPTDTIPNDYKLVEVKISCATCQGLQPFSATTYIAPKNLEQ